MAQVQIEEIVDHLSTEMKKALEDTLFRHFPDQSFDRNAVFRDFKKAVYRKCNLWETVPDQYVRKD